jgi:hypothetical protein
VRTTHENGFAFFYLRGIYAEITFFSDNFHGDQRGRTLCPSMLEILLGLAVQIQ